MEYNARDITHIVIRRIKMEETWNEFQQVQSVIENMGEMTQNENEHFPYHEDFEGLFFKSVSETEKIKKSR